MSSQRALIPLRFTDTKHWKKGLVRLLTQRKDTEQMPYLSDFWEFIYTVREKVN